MKQALHSKYFFENLPGDFDLVYTHPLDLNKYIKALSLLSDLSLGLVNMLWI